MIIPFVRTRNFTWTLLGGANFSIDGMGSASSWCQIGLPSLISKFPLPPPTLWVMQPSSNTSGSVVCGQHLSYPYLLRTRSSFPLLWLHTLYWWGPQWSSSSCATMSGWWLFCLLAPSEAPNLLMVLMRFLALLAVRHSFSFKASSVRGRANPVADALSRFQFQRFRCLAPQADLAVTPVPLDLLEALLVTWRTGAISSSPRASLPLHIRCTSLHSIATLIFVGLMAVLVLKVPFSQRTSSPLCVLPQC